MLRHCACSVAFLGADSYPESTDRAMGLKGVQYEKFDTN